MALVVDVNIEGCLRDIAEFLFGRGRRSKSAPPYGALPLCTFVTSPMECLVLIPNLLFSPIDTWDSSYAMLVNKANKHNRMMKQGKRPIVVIFIDGAKCGRVVMDIQ